MSRATAWTDFRAMKVESLIELFSEQEFTSLISGHQHVVVKADRSRIYPTDTNAGADAPSNWLVPTHFDVAAVSHHYAASVKCEPLRFSYTLLKSMFEMAHDNMDALERLRRVFAPDINYASEEQAAYMRLMRRQLLQVLVNDRRRWADFCHQMLSRFPLWINFAFSLLPQMQQAVDPVQFMAMLNEHGGGQTVLGYLTEQWAYIEPHVDALGCYHLLSAFCAPGVDQDPPQCLIDKSIELWNSANDATYLSDLLFALVLRRDEVNIEKLLKAASAGLVEAINHKDEHGNLVLHAALAANLSDKLIGQLIALTDDPAQKSPMYLGRTPLQMACAADRGVVVEHLLRYHTGKAHINDQDDAGDSALHLAARFGADMVLALLLEGCLQRGDALSIKAKNADGHTVLHTAAMRDDHRLLALLLQHTECRPILDEIDRGGHTALMLACRSRFTPHVRLLMQRGANAGVSNFSGKRAADFADDDIRAVLATDDVHRFQITAHLHRGFPGYVPVAKPLYDFQGPAEYVRAKVFAVVKCLQVQMTTDTRFTRDVVAIRLRFDQVIERLYRAKSFNDINYELLVLHSEQHTWREDSGDCLRSYLRSTTVLELKALDFVRDLAVSGVAYWAEWVRSQFWNPPARDPVMRRLIDWDHEPNGATECKREAAAEAVPLLTDYPAGLPSGMGAAKAVPVMPSAPEAPPFVKSGNPVPSAPPPKSDDEDPIDAFLRKL